MLLKLIIIIEFITIGAITTVKSSIRTENSSICFIRNIKYTDEYLYTSHELDRFDHDINNGLDKRKVFANEMQSKYMNHFRQASWIVQPVFDMEKTFYLSNLEYPNHVLCASSEHLDRFNHRRIVNLNRMASENQNLNNTKCMWRLEKQTKGGESEFIVWNIRYKEPLYAVSFLFKTARTNKRNIYTWHKKPDSKQFIWNFNCLIKRDVFNQLTSV